MGIKYILWLLVLCVGLIVFFISPSVFITALIVLFVYEYFNKSDFSSNFKYSDLPSATTYDQFMSAERKSQYLKSSRWETIRTIVLARDNNKCVTCGSTEHLQIHHITYERLGDEHLSDLVTLCGTCHQAVHDKLGYDRTTTYKITKCTH